MKREILYMIFGVAMLTAVSCTTDSAQKPAIEKAPDCQNAYIAGQVLVKFTPEVVDILEKAGLTRGGELTRSGVPSLDEVLEIVGGCYIERLFPIDQATEERTRANGLHRWFVIRFDESLSTADVAARFAALGQVQKVDFNRTIKRAYNGKATPLTMEQLQAMSRTTRATNNDPLLAEQWNLINHGDKFNAGQIKKSVAGADAGCEGAWERSRGDNSVVVAVLDEGIFIEHPELAENIWINDDEIARSENDNDNNGYCGDINGYNFVYDSGVITWNNAMDSGHGTHVAGVISAVNNNGQGISSIAGGDGTKGSGVKIMVCQIFSGNTASSLLATVRAIKYAADNGAVVLQCSWGYVSPKANIYDWGESGFADEEEWRQGSPLESEALEYFTHNAGSPTGAIDGGIAIFAGGNESGAAAGFPGAADGYVSVAATAADFTPAVYTNYGPGTTISAPGGDQEYTWEYDAESVGQGINNIVDVIIGSRGGILSTMPLEFTNNSGYGYMDGTSMACPHVSGVLALAASYVADQRRIVKAEELQKLLHSTATKIEGLWPSHKMYYIYLQSIGKYMADEMTLSKYKGQMGSGLVNATALINALDGVGVPMTFPNVYVGLGEKATLVPARYFANGEKLTYTVTISNTDIASNTNKDGKLTFEGLKEGSTTATITTSGGVSQQFLITVRKGAGSLGWM